ncbi:hypothetical protein Tco_0506215 [Tanacetum coccineum]
MSAQSPLSLHTESALRGDGSGFTKPEHDMKYPNLVTDKQHLDYLIPTEEEELHVVEEEMEDAEDFVPRPQIHDDTTTLHPLHDP